MVRRVIIALLLSVTASAWAGPWLEDWEAARRAASTGKPLVVAVTASDWSPACQIMEAEVFSRPEFLAAQDQFVLVNLDFPRSKPQAERLRLQNQHWVANNPVDGYPTYFVLDGRGVVLGRQTGVVDGGTAAFLALVRGFVDRKPTLDALVAAVAAAPNGEAKAKAEDALFRQAEAWDLAYQYGDLPLKIVQDDRDGKAGLKERYQVLNAYNRFLATWSSLPDLRQAVVQLDGLADRAAAWPDLNQKVQFTKAMVLLNALNDETGARTAFRQARDLGPTTNLGLQASRLLDTLP